MISRETLVDVDPDIYQSVRGLGERYGLTDRQLGQLVQLLASLSHDELAPTSVREPAQAVDVHLADSLVALELERVREALKIADIGAGAGFPGLPLAVALPQGDVTLVDSQARKCAFVERVVEAARVENAETVCRRVEEWPEGIGAHDVVLARAVAPQQVVLEYAAPLLRLGGSLVDWRGRRDPEEEQAALEAGAILGLERELLRHVEPYAAARDHHLHVWVKTRETPNRFPRRVGQARKKPLSGRTRSA
jgi:16S rRNA (guanine527-N7)-methyltransferase